MGFLLQTSYSAFPRIKELDCPQGKISNETSSSVNINGKLKCRFNFNNISRCGEWDMRWKIWGKKCCVKQYFFCHFSHSIPCVSSWLFLFPCPEGKTRVHSKEWWRKNFGLAFGAQKFVCRIHDMNIVQHPFLIDNRIDEDDAAPEGL